MLSWFATKRKRRPNAELPLQWTSSLWDELAGGQHDRSFDLQCFIGIESLTAKFDFNAELGEQLDSVEVKREYAGFIGAQPGTRIASLRASLSFVQIPESVSAFSRLPEDSAGWGQTVNNNYVPPSLHFEVFSSAENQRVFEELFVRAKMLHIGHVPVSIWAKSLEPWWNIQDQNVFARVFTIKRVIFEQRLHLRGEVKQSLWHPDENGSRNHARNPDTPKPRDDAARKGFL